MRRWAAFMLVVALARCTGCDDLGEPIHADCGDGVVNGLEVCDGTALGSATCASLGFSGGALACSPSCGGFIVAGCEGLRDELDPCSLCLPDEGCVANRCVSTCDVAPFTADTHLDFDLKTSTVSGHITVNGQRPDLPAGDSLRFEGSVYWEPAITPIEADGTFEVTLSPDTYEVTWIPSPAAHLGAERLNDIDVTDDLEVEFALTPWTEVVPEVVTDWPDDIGNVLVEPLDPEFGRVELPLDGSVLRVRDGDLRLWWRRPAEVGFSTEFLETTTARDLVEAGIIEIPVIESTIHLTMNGSPVPTSGAVRAELVRGDDLPRPGWLGVSRDREAWLLDGDGRASGWMLDRPRDIALVIDGPPSSGWLWAQRDVAPTSDIEIDLRAPRLAGEVRRNGDRLPNSALQGIARGRLEFTSDDGYLSVELSDRGRGEFEARLPAGVWDVQVSGVVFAGVLPVVPWDAPEPITLQGDTDDAVIDVPAVRLAGQLTVNGQRPGDDLELETRGSLQLKARTGNIWFSIPIPPRGPAGWDVVVAPGDYQAELVRWWFAMNGESAPPGVLPLGSWVVGEFAVPQATRYDVDVRLSEVTVDVLDGDAPAPPGLLWFTRLPDQRVARQIDTTGGPKTVTLYPGFYEVAWAPYDADGRAVEPVVLASRLRVDGGVEEEFDVAKVELTGTILVDGMDLLDAGERDVELTRQPYANWTSTIPLNPAGAADFRVDVVNGRYAIVLGAGDDPRLPANGVLLHSACIAQPTE